MGLNDRSADRKPHAQAIRFGCVECAENSMDILELEAGAGVLDRRPGPGARSVMSWLGREDSNLRMAESKTT
jgi:hypothetical protein